MDILHTHTLDIKEGLKKIRIDKYKKVIGEHRNSMSPDINERVQQIWGQIENEEGCRI